MQEQRAGATTEVGAGEIWPICHLPNHGGANPGTNLPCSPKVARMCAILERFPDRLRGH